MRGLQHRACGLGLRDSGLGARGTLGSGLARRIQGFGLGIQGTRFRIHGCDLGLRAR